MSTLLGEVFSGYRAVTRLGGRMTNLYAGVGVSDDSDAVIKVWLRLDGAAEAERILGAARAAAALGQRGIATIYDAAVDTRALVAAYMVLERLDGEDLAQRLTRGPLTPLRALAFIRDTVETMAAVHRAGLFHGALAPGHLFAARDEHGHERIKILDFGAFDTIRAEAARKLARANFSSAVPPAYITPEEAVGIAPLDARMDLYALGCIFYALYAGAPPFAGSFSEIMDAHARNQPPPPLPPTVPPPVPELIVALLSRDPSERPSCAAIAVELDRL